VSPYTSPQVSAYRKVTYRVERGIARIALNRPERRNALDQELLTELREALRASATDESVGVVLVTGAGKDFCSGMDLRTFADDASGDLAKFQTEARNMAGLLLDMRRHPRPIVAAVQGRALGGGCGIATAADMVLAEDAAQFGYPEINIGFVPAIVMAILRRLVSEKRAFELVASGEIISAQTALEYGMINRVFSAETFERAVEEFVTNLGSKSTSALALAKELFYRTDAMQFDAAMGAGAEINAFARTTDDFKRGIEKFTTAREKPRPPKGGSGES
jgi:methylglutaconyl-CoA hydratase